MEATAAIALGVAVLSAVVTFVGLWWERRGRGAALEAELAKQRASISKEFVLAQYEHRAATYAPVLATLGAVRDTPDPVEERHYRQLHEDPAVLTGTAEELLKHLYGEPGLFMHLSTRNALLRAYEACFRYQSREIGLDDLVVAFFRARRHLRADIEVIDGEDRKNLAGALDALKPERTASC